MIDYIAIVGANHYHGIDIFKVGKTVELIKD